MEDSFVINGVTLSSRLFIGTGKYGADSLIPQVAAASGAAVITVAMRRVDRQNPADAADPARQGVMAHIPKICACCPIRRARARPKKPCVWPAWPAQPAAATGSK